MNEVKSFVLEELNHLSERPKTDSRACLRMVMSLPVCVVEEVLSDVVPALQVFEIILHLSKSFEKYFYSSFALFFCSSLLNEVPKTCL